MEVSTKGIQEGRLKTPTLLAWGFHDPSAVISGGMELFGLLAPSVLPAQMHIFNKAGHYPYREYPEGFARVVTDFILFGLKGNGCKIALSDQLKGPKNISV